MQHQPIEDIEIPSQSVRIAGRVFVLQEAAHAVMGRQNQLMNQSIITLKAFMAKGGPTAGEEASAEREIARNASAAFYRYLLDKDVDGNPTDTAWILSNVVEQRVVAQRVLDVQKQLNSPDITGTEWGNCLNLLG